MIRELVLAYMVWGWFAVAGAAPSIYLYLKGRSDA